MKPQIKPIFRPAAPQEKLNRTYVVSWFIARWGNTKCAANSGRLRRGDTRLLISFSTLEQRATLEWQDVSLVLLRMRPETLGRVAAHDQVGTSRNISS